ncbi:lanthionine synthetase C family protein [Pseudonocardia acaciae]|uniref:lanthionine synthetase C family protein n=1 Tax=Pseudonocardia acaciae TaxID=551276 RepID=UPI00048FCF84|nr:lanthionine synthetase C family protein [Pseudonocardia acaciae]
MSLQTARAPELAARAQSLAMGAAGTALLSVERARNGAGSWEEVHAALAACTRYPLIADQNASLYFGAPAVAFAIHTAAHGTGRYEGALRSLDAQVTALIRRRLDQAHQRIDRGERPRVGEFDLFYGLTGLGSYLLRRDPQSEALSGILSYLARLTLPLADDDEQLPGWWTDLDPSGGSSDTFAGGHGNLGMAHGISGPLALLSVAKLHGVTVDDHTATIERIVSWLDTLRQEEETGPWWPNWINLVEHRSGTISHSGPLRPSWCYGTPGLARAQQLGALALGDTTRQHMAEHALRRCLADLNQLAQICDAGLCHGAAGLLHTVHRVAHDAPAGAFTEHLPRLRALLLDQQPARESGLLEGTTGPSLALLADDSGGTTASGWDACLLVG